MISKLESGGYRPFEQIASSKRGLFDQNGNAILIRPTHAQIAGLPDDPRVEYFSTLSDKPATIDGIYEPVSPVEMSPYFIQYVLDPLSVKLRKDFSRRKRLGIRGTAVSMDGDLPYKDRLSHTGLDNVMLVRGMDSILKAGSDSGQEKPGCAVFDLKGESSLSAYSFPTNYLRFYSRGFNYSLRYYGYNLNAVFPLLLVYDLNYSTKSGTINLEAARKHGGDALLKAYVLDYSPFENI